MRTRIAERVLEKLKAHLKEITGNVKVVDVGLSSASPSTPAVVIISRAFGGKRYSYVTASRVVRRQLLMDKRTIFNELNSIAMRQSLIIGIRVS
jgi:hypothetical protein